MVEHRWRLQEYAASSTGRILVASADGKVAVIAVAVLLLATQYQRWKQSFAGLVDA